MVQTAFQSGYLPAGVDETLIALIPKIDHPEKIEQLRPISLSNVVGRIISKVIVTRIRPILSKIISPYQVSFIPGRSTTDNIIVLQTVILFIAYLFSVTIYSRKIKVTD